MIPVIRIEDYTYALPEERIAKYPLSERDSSKLLIYKDGEVRDSVFRNIPDELPSDAIMIFNDTKVVPARLFFRRPTGAHIEIFCLEPDTPAEYDRNFATTDCCRWKCVIGNAKRWKDDLLSFDSGENEAATALQLKASLVSRDGQTGEELRSRRCWNCAARCPFLPISIARRRRSTSSAIRPCMRNSAVPLPLPLRVCISPRGSSTISGRRA